ncbi:N-formylglutamate amidohydrolase [Paroceanicella profunda]|uniref:N-formylglutamate amidohydrolase n=1 Tax=Paroceanicella profunda TaxID=2579971 RepID=A0A5B8G1F8_9RHOB|nr:N-formylglutamate amidohydrolase [Paroceanicella profunda]QDL92313.1 N-formylglutamate amidohydrolase [Paroceanicella profunda]
MRQDAFILREPDRLRSCAVFSSPHSGRHYPESFTARSRLSPLQLRLSEDAYVDRLYATAPELGAPLLAAVMPRAWLDLNRGPTEMDPALVQGVRSAGLNPRVAAGLGVVPRVVAEGMPIYSGKITAADAQARVSGFHTPYHDTLAGLAEAARRRFGIAVLFDCHSMPSDALRSFAGVRSRRPEIVLGDRYGASAAPWVADATQEAFEAAGFQVARNTPFAGGYITQRHGRPQRGVHAIQIEIDRGLYLDELAIAPGEGFPDMLMRMQGVVAALARIGQAEARVAAE